jgi:hypothetical protein
VTRRRPLLAASGLLLAVLSAALWQGRFERTGPALGLRIGGDFHGWKVLAADRIAINGTTWTLQAPAGREVASAEGPLPGATTTRHLHVGLAAAWENVTRRDGRSWWSARVSLGGQLSDGSYAWPQDGDLINARGSRGWHRVECVYDLPPDLGEPRLFINQLAATGILRVRQLTVTPVRQRPWVPAATAGLLAAWLAWSASLLGTDRGRVRQAAAAGVLVAAGWFLVFPQPHYHARAFPGGFALGREIPPPAAAASPVAPLSFFPAAPLLAAASPAPPPLPPQLEPPPDDPRAGHGLARAFRKLDENWRFAHVAAFGGFGLVLFALAGLRAGWPAAAALGLLSEIVPNLLRREFRGDDAVDLVANFAGLGLAAAMVHLAGIFRARRRLEAARPPPLAPGAGFGHVGRGQQDGAGVETPGRRCLQPAPDELP